MGQVWDIELPHHQQGVLLAMADHARDDGTSVYPSIEYLSWKTGYSERNVQRVLRELEDAELIVQIGNTHGGRGIKCEWQIHLENGAKKSPFNESKGRQNVTVKKGDILSKGDKSDTKRVTDETLKGDKSDTAHIEYPRVEPLEKHQDETSDCTCAIASEKEGEEKAPDDHFEERAERSDASELIHLAAAPTAEEIYRAYPRRIDHKPALAAIKTALKRLKSEMPPGEADPAKFLLARTIAFANHCRATGKEQQFILYPARWFGRSRYLETFELEAPDATDGEFIKPDGTFNMRAILSGKPREVQNVSR